MKLIRQIVLTVIWTEFEEVASPPCACSSDFGLGDGSLSLGAWLPRAAPDHARAGPLPIPVWGILFGSFVLPGSVGGAGGVRHRSYRVSGANSPIATRR